MAQAQTGQVTAFRVAVAESVAEHDEIATFYRARNFEPLWTGAGPEHLARREALLEAIGTARTHGLPAGRYDIPKLIAGMRAARSDQARGALDVELSRVFVQFAHDLESGVLTPGRVLGDIKREPVRRHAAELLSALETGAPRAVLRGLAPRTQEYARLMRAKMELERALARGGWGAEVGGGTLSPGDSGERVVALRNRLIAMGYLERTARATYDDRVGTAVRLFQADHGLEADGVAGQSTLDALNVSAEARLQSVVVAMERERWLSSAGDMGARHIKVNLTEFSARIYDDEKVTFETRAVIGATSPDRRTPEFSDEMDHMVINPSWYVPRSIIRNEYLPQLQRNPYAVSHLQIIDSRGRVVNRARGFGSNFPYSMRQPPGPNNALGKVKFMFPNKYNIYLHDTPAKHLFAHDVRAYSHGCIRLNEPFEFAYTLLAAQEADPEGFFHARLRTGAEARVNLETPVPVHLIYRTAYTQAKGNVQYRADIYGRDGRIWAALEDAGVVLGVGES
nr:L,D-transpeptidase family protein [Roseivivax isoporae]